MKAVLMAGGRGTRISALAPDIPKPMIRLQGKPILEHEIECLRAQGITDLIVTVSHFADVIMDYFGDGSGISPATGRPFGVKITYYREERPLGNAGALFQIRDQLSDTFLLLNADAIFDVNFDRMVRFHRAHGAQVTLLTHPNSHPYDSGLLIADERSAVETWLTKEDTRPRYYRNRVNAGIHVLERTVLEDAVNALKQSGALDAETGEAVRVDLDRQLLRPLAGTGRMFCYDSPEYVRDMGTPERYEEVTNDFASGLVQARNLSHSQRAIFLDRDGTINRYVGFLRETEQLELLPDVGEAIRAINRSGYLCIVVTNQPVLARGEVTVSQLEEIHNRMETLLGQQGAYLDAIYVCPHHPDKGFEGEVPSLKVVCDCRKPKPGLLMRAAAEFNIDLASSWMVGDSEADVRAGQNAGCRTALLAPDGADAFGADATVQSLSAFVKMLVQERANP